MYYASHNSEDVPAFGFVDSGFARLLLAAALYFAIQYALTLAA